MPKLDTAVIADSQGRRIRFCGTVRWSDFDLFGEAGRAKALRAGSYFQRVMGATRHGQPFDAEAVLDGVGRAAVGCKADEVGGDGVVVEAGRDGVGGILDLDGVEDFDVCGVCGGT